MRLIRVLVIASAVVVMSGSVSGSIAVAQTAGAAVQDRQPTKPPDEFVPIDELPPEEQMPAAPMVVAAYVFVWVAFLAYVFTLVKRIRRVEADLRSLEQGRR